MVEQSPEPLQLVQMPLKLGGVGRLNGKPVLKGSVYLGEGKSGFFTAQPQDIATRTRFRRLAEALTARRKELLP
jgi:hypothetical protein